MWSTLIKAPWGYITPAPFIVLEAHRLDDAPFFQIRHPALDLAQPEPMLHEMLRMRDASLSVITCRCTTAGSCSSPYVNGGLT